VSREKLAARGSGILIALAIIALPNQFLFSKTVPNSFWTRYFPLPFGAGWFLTFVVLTPSIWMSDGKIRSIRKSLLYTLIAPFVAVPISLFHFGGSALLENVINVFY